MSSRLVPGGGGGKEGGGGHVFRHVESLEYPCCRAHPVDLPHDQCLKGAVGIALTPDERIILPTPVPSSEEIDVI